jgi:acyl-CoA hydrolase
LPVGLEAPARLAPCLGERHDLGVHNKVIWGGTPQLAKKGVVTEGKKRLHPVVRGGS